MPPVRDPYRVLLELTGNLSDDSSLEEALQCLTDAALELLPADHASVRILDDSGWELLAGARSGAGVGHQVMRFRRGEGVVGWVVDHGELARLDDTRSDERFEQRAEQGFAMRSLLVVPLWSGPDVVGALGVTSEREAAFGPDDELCARLLANCAAPALDRVRLKRIAITDPDTMAYSGRYLAPRLDDEIARARDAALPLTLLILDLQAPTHTRGAALRAFADDVRSQLERTDVLVRHGRGFALILPGVGEDGAVDAAARLCELADERTLVYVGVALWRRGESPHMLVHRAGEAVLAARQSAASRIILAA